MICTLFCAHSHLEMKLNDITLVSVMVSDTYTIIKTDPIPPKMANTDINIWYQCIPNFNQHSYHSISFTSILVPQLANQEKITSSASPIICVDLLNYALNHLIIPELFSQKLLVIYYSLA